MNHFETTAVSAPGVLARAATEFGVELKYWDIWGKLHEAPEDVLRAVLKALGVDARNEEAVSRALEDRQREMWSRLLPPTIVTSQLEPHVLLAIPAESAGAKVRMRVSLENGGEREFEFDLGALPTSGRERLDASEFVRKQVVFADGLPLGYHRLAASVEGQEEQTALFIVCPDRAYQPEFLKHGKAAGIGISLYGVRSARNWGCGDCTDLRQLIDWTADDLNASFIALNPLHAIANRAPYNTSPYLPNSIFYRNHIYLDVERVEDFTRSHWAQALFHSEKIRQEIQALREAETVEYQRVSRLKSELLKVCFLNFLIKEYRRGTSRAEAFKAYVEREGSLLHQYALHAALDETMHRRNRESWNFSTWPEAYRTPGSREVAEFEKSHWRSILFHQYVQWQLDLQFDEAQQYAREKGLQIGLYHDMALATDRFGSDLWAHRDFYATGCRVGSPPDSFSPKGQDWSFPPPNSRRHFEDGYRLFAEAIRKASAHGGALRIDHVMRFFRLYWIPDGMDATEGTYVQDRYEDLIRVLALESVRNQFLVVGEDLGTVPDYIRDTLKQFGILSYRLFYFEKDKQERFRRPDEYPVQALVSATTHDLPTLAGFWSHADIEARRSVGLIADEESYRSAINDRMREKAKMLELLKGLGLLPEWYPTDARQVPELTGDLHNAIVGFLAITPSELMVLNQEDLFKDPQQQNLPGTTAESPNWRHKMMFSIEDLRTPAVQGYVAMFRNWLERSGRVNRS